MMWRLVFLLTIPFLIPACSNSVAEVKPKFSPRCQATAVASNAYVVGGDDSQAKLTKQVFNSLARKQGGQITIDQINGEQLNTLYSSRFDRAVLQRMGKEWSGMAITGDGLAAPFERLHSLSEVHTNTVLQAYILTPGTSDLQVLAKLTSAAQELKSHPCVQVNVIGLDKVNRLKMAEALKPIRDRLRFASDNRQEWQQLID
jgi:hypothetical protein